MKALLRWMRTCSVGCLDGFSDKLPVGESADRTDEDISMKSRLLLVLFVSLFGMPVVQADEFASAARALPLPAAASAELQSAIRDWPMPDVAAAQVAPASIDEWTASIAQMNALWAADINPMLERYAVKMMPDRVAGVPVHRLVPAAVSPTNARRLFLYVHGGGYVYGGGDASLAEAILIASRVGIAVLSVDYRMPPQHPFPAAVDDVVAVYQQVLKDLPASSIVIGGTSAGGGLALAAVQRFRDLKLPLPAAIFAGTPWADLTKTGDTLYANEGVDRVLVTYDGWIRAAARLYAGDYALTHPLISPLYGDFTGFPPTIVTTGTRDLLLSDSARTHRKLRAAGVAADLHVYEGMSHADYIVSPDIPESRNMYAEIKAFIDQHLD